MVASSLVLTGLISVGCSGLVGNDLDGCSNGIKAVGYESGIDKRIKSIEDKIGKDTEDAAKKYLDASTIEVMSTAILGVRLIAGDTVTYRVGKFYIETSKAKTEIGVLWNL